MADAKRTTKKPKRSKRLQAIDKVDREAAKRRGGHKSIEQLAKEQGIELHPWTEKDFERMRKLGKGLFRSDKEFDDFLNGIYERRRQSRGP